jgi:hypothetical protein
VIIYVDGPKHFRDYPLLEASLDRWEFDLMVSNGEEPCRLLWEKYAAAKSIPIERIESDWKQGYTAEYVRNTAIMERSDIAVIFDDGSKRVKKFLQRALEVNFPFHSVFIPPR